MKKSNVLILCLQLLAYMPMALASELEDPYMSVMKHNLLADKIKNVTKNGNKSSNAKREKLDKQCQKVYSKHVGQVKDSLTDKLKKIVNDESLTSEEKEKQKRKILLKKLDLSKKKASFKRR